MLHGYPTLLYDVEIYCYPMNIEQFEEWALYIGIGGLLILMVFIVWNLGRESKAGKFGMLILFLALALGLLGFIVKLVLVEMLQP